MNLSSLDPKSVADATVQRMFWHLELLGGVLDPTMRIRVSPEGDGAKQGTTLWKAVHCLTLYAQRGLPIDGWGSHGEALQAYTGATAALWAHAADPPGPAPEMDIGDPVGIVFVGAFARIAIASKLTVTPRDLAVLSGLSLRAVQHLCMNGEIAATDTKPRRIEAATAKRWLLSRGVTVDE
jgi:hypothetical protein